MSEERSGARETLDEAREMREHEEQAKEHAETERRPGEAGGDDTDGPDQPTPFGGASRG
jgi:hypothetical protein